MANKPRPEPDDPEQSKRFVDTAKQLEADETGSFFDRAFGVVKTAPAPQPTPKAAPARSPGKKSSP
jgi:hypothetical protein